MVDAGPVCQKSTLESSRNTAASGAILRAVICDTMNERMNDNLYIAHKKLPHKTLRVHSARYTQCIHVSSRKLKLPMDTHTKKYKQLLPTHPFPKVELYITVKCKNIYRVINNDNRKKDQLSVVEQQTQKMTNDQAQS